MRLFALVCTLVCALGSVSAPAQMMTVSGSQITDSTNTVVADATMTWAPVNKTGAALSYRRGGGGQVAGVPVTTQVTNGVFSLPLPNVALTNPANVCFSVTLKDNVSGNKLPFPGHECVQPSTDSSQSGWCTSSTTCNFDLFIPSTPALTTTTAGPPGPPVNFRGPFDSAAVYAKGDAVSFTDGSSYISLSDGNTGNAPPTSTGAWGVLARAPQIVPVPLTANEAQQDFLLPFAPGSVLSVSRNGLVLDRSTYTISDVFLTTTFKWHAGNAFVALITK